MESPPAFRKPWPTGRQALLLKAALACPDARDAFAQWEPTFDPERVDPETVILLPLLSRSLRTQGINSPFEARYAAVYRWSWYRNQLQFAALKQAMTALENAAIPTLLLKGVSLAATTYADEGLRPMSDTDLLVPSPSAIEAARILGEIGFAPVLPVTDRTMSQRHSLAFERDGCEVDLHWHVLQETVDEQADDAFWAASIPRIWRGLPTRTLCPADDLLLVIAHAAQGGTHVPPLCWIADAVTILRRHSASIDWQRFETQARHQQLALAMRRALDYLVETFDAPVPPAVRSALASAPIAKTERLEYWFKMHGASLSPLGALPRYWFTHQRLRRTRTGSEGTQSFLTFIQERHPLTTGQIIRRGSQIPLQLMAWLWQHRKDS